jgi:hypothetical protein
MLVTLVAGQANAQQVLIAEFTFDDFEFGNFGNNPPSTFDADFAIGEQYVGRWSRDVSVADVGSVFPVEPDQVALMALGIENDANDNVEFGAGLGPALQYSFFERELLNGAYENASLTMHVPSLRTFPLTAVTITMDSLQVVPQNGYWQYGGAFTARLYTVPEPISLVLLLVALTAISCHWRGTPHHAVLAS